MAKETKKWVLLENQNEMSQSFSDHRGNALQLAGRGKKEAKIQISLDDLSEDGLHQAVNSYSSLKKIGGLRITFSKDCPTKQDTKTNTTVASTAGSAAEIQDKAQWIRDQHAKNSRDNRIAMVRLAHLKALQNIGTSEAPDTPETKPGKAEVKKATNKPGKTEQTKQPVKEVDKTINADETQVDLTPEVISAMDEATFATLLNTLGIEAGTETRMVLEALVLDKLSM